jgi:hypothetical protein
MLEFGQCGIGEVEEECEVGGPPKQMRPELGLEEFTVLWAN